MDILWEYVFNMVEINNQLQLKFSQATFFFETEMEMFVKIQLEHVLSQITY